MARLDDFHSTNDKSDSAIMEMKPVEAIDIIMDIYGDEIKRLVFTYIQNKADTDDVSQDVFITIFQKLHTFQGKSSLRSWIYTIAINQAKDHLRSWQSRNKRLKDKLRQSASFLSKDQKTPEEYMIKRTTNNHLLTQVMDLSNIYREVIILYYFQELSTQEISEILHTKEATIRTRLSRAREKLKQLLLVERGEDLG